MGIGSGIVLFVIGAILTFALNVRVDWIDLDLVGYILMIVVLFRRRSSISTTRSAVDPAHTERVTERESRDDVI